MGYDLAEIISFGILSFLASASKAMLFPREKSEVRFFVGSFAFGLLLGFVALEVPALYKYAKVAAAAGGAFGEVLLRKLQTVAMQWVDKQKPPHKS